MHHYLRALFDRLLAILGRTLASRVEAIALLEESRHLQEVEAEAQQLEAAGMFELAATLRSRASSILPDNPAASILPAIEHVTAAKPAPEESPAAPLCIAQTAATTGQRRKRRSPADPETGSAGTV